MVVVYSIAAPTTNRLVDKGDFSSPDEVLQEITLGSHIIHASISTQGRHAIEEPVMQVKGEALISFPVYILKKFGNAKYKQWVTALTPTAQHIYSTPIDKNAWYPLNEALTEPTKELCDMFFNKSLRGAWECGRNSADYGLRGITGLLVKLQSPDVLVGKAATILPHYYKPSALEVSAYDKEKNCIVLKIVEFPEINHYIEHRIGGWIERALQICGCKHLNVQISSSLTDKSPSTDYKISWKKY